MTAIYHACRRIICAPIVPLGRLYSTREHTANATTKTRRHETNVWCHRTGSARTTKSTKATKPSSDGETTVFVCFVFFVVPKTRPVTRTKHTARLSKRCSFQRTRRIEGVSLQRLGIAVVGGSVWTTPALMTLEPEIEASRTLVDVSVYPPEPR